MASAETPIMLSLFRWHAARTAPRHEKNVLRHLEARSVESFLPLYGSTRLWNGRPAFVQAPLFPGYLFVRISAEHRMAVLEVPGVLGIVSSRGALSSLPEGQVEKLRAALELRKLEPHPLLTRGQRLRIECGPLRGLEGIVVNHARPLSLVVSIGCIQRAFAVELDASDLESTAQAEFGAAA